MKSLHHLETENKEVKEVNAELSGSSLSYQLKYESVDEDKKNQEATINVLKGNLNSNTHTV